MSASKKCMQGGKQASIFEIPLPLVLLRQLLVKSALEKG